MSKQYNYENASGSEKNTQQTDPALDFNPKQNENTSTEFSLNPNEAPHLASSKNRIGSKEDPTDSELSIDQLLDKLVFLCESQNNYECVEDLYNEFLSIKKKTAEIITVMKHCTP